MKTKLLHITLIILMHFIFNACNTTKYVKDNEYLLEENNIYVNNEKNKSFEINSYLLQKPNNKLINIPIGLHIYNLGNNKYDSIFKTDTKKLENTDNFLTSIFSKKQVLGFYNNKKNINNWFFKYGENPVIVNDQKTKKNVTNLRKLYFNKGYFDNEVSVNTFNDTNKSTINYYIKTKDPYFIGNINYTIPSKEIEKLIKALKPRLPIQTGDQFDIKNLKSTVTDINKYLRNNGYYHFSENVISFREIDTLASNNITPLNLVIENRKVEKNNTIEEVPFKAQTIKKINVFTDYSFKERNTKYNLEKEHDSILFLAHNKYKHNPKVLANAIFIKPNQLFSDKNIELSRKQLNSLNNFKSIKINHKELNDKELVTNIILTPQKKYAVGINTEIIHSNIKQIGISGGFSFINRNLFKGAEVFKLSTQGSVFDSAISDGDNDNFNAYEIGVDASLEFPKLLFPFLSKIIPRETTPRTKMTLGTSFQENIGLDRQNFNGVINYNWKPSTNNTHTIELLNLQLINNLNPKSYYDIYNSEYSTIEEIQPLIDPDFELTTSNASFFLNNISRAFQISNPEEYNTLQNIINRENIITSNYLIPATSYTYEHNSKKGFNDSNYNFFKGKISSSGNINTLFYQDKGDQKFYNDIAVSQFVKIDLDFRNFWRTSQNSSLALRTFIGAILPTGENQNIPFVTSYFSGGSNDIRAWRAYELGPGSSNSGLEYNIGNLKLLSSIEYRFKVVNSIHGALFIDSGNIWNLPDTNTAAEEEIFNGISSLENIAVGSGVGIRYNLSFLVLRLDLAFKTYEPYLEDNKWFSNYNINNSVLNLGINYPF